MNPSWDYFRYFSYRRPWNNSSQGRNRSGVWFVCVHFHVLITHTYWRFAEMWRCNFTSIQLIICIFMRERCSIHKTAKHREKTKDLMRKMHGKPWGKPFYPHWRGQRICDVGSRTGLGTGWKMRQWLVRKWEVKTSGLLSGWSRQPDF